MNHAIMHAITPSGAHVFIKSKPGVRHGLKMGNDEVQINKSNAKVKSVKGTKEEEEELKRNSRNEKSKTMTNSPKSIESDQKNTNLIESKNINTGDSKIEMPVMTSIVVDSTEGNKSNVVVTSKDDTGAAESDKPIEAINFAAPEKNKGEEKKKKGKVML